MVFQCNFIILLKFYGKNPASMMLFDTM